MKMSIIVGSEFNGCEHFNGKARSCHDNNRALAIVGKGLTRIFGGYSVYVGEGGWEQGGRLITERHFRFEVFYNGNDRQPPSARDVANLLRQEFMQDTVVLTTEHVEASFIGG